MVNLKVALLFSGVWLMVVAALVTPVPVAYNTVQVSWVTQPDTTWINVWDTNANEMRYAASVSSGVTNTLTLSATEGLVFQIQEYKLVNSRLELITFFNLAPVPASDFPTPIQTQQPANTPLPTLTVTPIQLKYRLYTPIVIH
jgi:hypothetical protein